MSNELKQLDDLLVSLERLKSQLLTIQAAQRFSKIRSSLAKLKPGPTVAALGRAIDELEHGKQ
jgi:hypothetical protein